MMVALAWFFLVAVALVVGWVAIDERGREAVAKTALDWFVPCFVAASFLVPIGVIAAVITIFLWLIGVIAGCLGVGIQ